MGFIEPRQAILIYICRCSSLTWRCYSKNGAFIQPCASIVSTLVPYTLALGCTWMACIQNLESPCCVKASGAWAHMLVWLTLLVGLSLVTFHAVVLEFGQAVERPVGDTCLALFRTVFSCKDLLLSFVWRAQLVGGNCCYRDFIKEV